MDTLEKETSVKVDWEQWGELQSGELQREQAKNDEGWQYPVWTAVGTAWQGGYEVYVVNMSQERNIWLDGWTQVCRRREEWVVMGVGAGQMDQGSTV